MPYEYVRVDSRPFWNNEYPKNWTANEEVRKEFDRLHKENEWIQANAVAELILLKKMLELFLPPK